MIGSYYILKMSEKEELDKIWKEIDNGEGESSPVEEFLEMLENL